MSNKLQNNNKKETPKWVFSTLAGVSAMIAAYSFAQGIAIWALMGVLGFVLNFIVWLIKTLDEKDKNK